MYDHEKRERQVNEFLNSKIKRCKKCRNELDYLEKFHCTDRICRKCQRVQTIENQQDESSHLKIENLLLPPLSDRINELQKMNMIAEKKWHEEHNAKARIDHSPKKEEMINETFDSEKILKLIYSYDEGKPVNISQEELISLLWEVLHHRGITSKS